MKINYLKDGLFDLLNDNSEELGISDIETHENENTFGISMTDGSVFEIKCRRILEREDEWTKESWLYTLGAERAVLRFHRLSCKENG